MTVYIDALLLQRHKNPVVAFSNIMIYYLLNK